MHMELKRSLNDTSINDDDNDVGFKFNDSLVVFENGKIHIYRNQGIRSEYEEQIRRLTQLWLSDIINKHD